ncbi:A-kinase anchor protein 7 isoform 4 [Mus musculus]|uniref:A kinase anchor protein 7 n=1 Tax=Mus musculus TaxID=10090 RepID=Q4KL21_MOUSE|nr:A-kinase anchor protein 7 isoform 4 [Mus musculus]AAH99487.1 Akap7 protein [Mus musculus]
MPFAAVDIQDDCGSPDVPQANPKRSKEEEEDRGDKNDHVKKRKKAKKDYQPNYFLSIPITNKKAQNPLHAWSLWWSKTAFLLAKERGLNQDTEIPSRLLPQGSNDSSLGAQRVTAPKLHPGH